MVDSFQLHADVEVYSIDIYNPVDEADSEVSLQSSGIEILGELDFHS